MLIGKNEDNLLEKNKIPDKKSRKIVRKLYSPIPVLYFLRLEGVGNKGSTGIEWHVASSALSCNIIFFRMSPQFVRRGSKRTPWR